MPIAKTETTSPTKIKNKQKGKEPEACTGKCIGTGRTGINVVIVILLN